MAARAVQLPEAVSVAHDVCSFGPSRALRAVEPGRRPVLELHPEREAARGEHFLDLVQRLAAEVRRLQQLGLGALDQVADVVDVLGLQAVGRTHRELELVDRAQQDRIDLRLGAAEADLVLTLQIDEHVELALQDRAGAANGLFGVDRAVGLDIHDQLVEIRTLLDARALHGVRDAADRAERRIELQAADRPALLLEPRGLHGRTVTAAAHDLQERAQLAGARQVRDHEVGVHDLDAVVDDDVAGAHRARALLRQTQLDLVARMHLDGDGLQVEQDVDDVFLDALDARVLVEHAFDLRLDDG